MNMNTNTNTNTNTVPYQGYKILFLDLDGTVRYSNNPSGFINRAEDVEVYREAKCRIHQFLNAGWKIVYITNQGGIAAGFTTTRDLIEGVEVMESKLDLPDCLPLYHCPHGVHQGCICRKPRPGLVVRALDDLAIPYRDIPFNLVFPNPRLTIDTRECLFVGDRNEDQECAAACGIPFMHAKEWRAGTNKILEPYLGELGTVTTGDGEGLRRQGEG
jgi:D-glycero-D-manno-heptose 1,7-bisphosphate phosphatase